MQGAGLARGSGRATDAEASPRRRCPRTGTCRRRRSRTRPRSTRSSTRSTSRPASRSSAGRQNAAVAIQDRGLDLNDAFGNLGPFITDASDVLETLNAPEGRAQGPGPRHRHGLRGADRSATRSSPTLIRTPTTTFDALASRGPARSPRRSRSSRPSATRPARRSTRLDSFANNTEPLIQDLMPVARRHQPRRFAASASCRPNLENLFKDLSPLLASRRPGCPALRQFLDALAPGARPRSIRSSPTSTRSSAT